MTDRRHEVLQRACEDVPRETFERLIQFERLFVEWNSRINLVSSSNLNHLWDRHIADSAQLLRWVDQGVRWLDVGSGGGFPGLIVAIMTMDQPESRFHLVESNQKKAAFLRRVSSQLGVAATIHACRVETLHDRLSGLDIITARAVTNLAGLLSLARPWLQSGAKALFQKGRDYRRELEDCRDEWTFDLIEHQSETDPEAVILEISNLGRQNQAPS